MKFYYTFSKIHLPFPYTVECGHHTNNLRPNKRHITMMGFLVFSLVFINTPTKMPSRALPHMSIIMEK